VFENVFKFREERLFVYELKTLKIEKVRFEFLSCSGDEI